jgi:hypothetical protein
MPQPDDPGSDQAELAALRRYLALTSDGIGNVRMERESVMGKVIIGLIIAGICGQVALYGQVKAMQSTLDLIVAGKIVIVHVP